MAPILQAVAQATSTFHCVTFSSAHSFVSSHVVREMSRIKVDLRRTGHEFLSSLYVCMFSLLHAPIPFPRPPNIEVIRYYLNVIISFFFFCTPTTMVLMYLHISIDASSSFFSLLHSASQWRFVMKLLIHFLVMNDKIVAKTSAPLDRTTSNNFICDFSLRECTGNIFICSCFCFDWPGFPKTVSPSFH